MYLEGWGDMGVGRDGERGTRNGERQAINDKRGTRNEEQTGQNQQNIRDITILALETSQE